MDINPHKDFTPLTAWLKAKMVRNFFYAQVIPHLPPDERFNLCEQMRRACVSGTANIAEGYGRYYYTEGIQFYRIARGSLYELNDHLISCLELGYITSDIFDAGKTHLDEAKRTLNGYIKYVQNRKRAQR
jgi:four helix bundle protein